MTMTHEPVEIHRSGDHYLSQREKLEELGDTLLTFTGAIAYIHHVISSPDEPLGKRLAATVQLNQAMHTVSSPSSETTPFSIEAHENPSVEKVAAMLEQLAQSCPEGTSIKDFQDLMIERGIDPQDQTTLQALLLNTGAGRISISDKDETVSASQPELEVVLA